MTKLPEEKVIFEYDHSSSSDIAADSDKQVQTKITENQSVAEKIKIKQESIPNNNTQVKASTVVKKSQKSLANSPKGLYKSARNQENVMVSDDEITVEPTEWPHIISFLLVVLPLILVLIGYLILYLFFEIGLFSFPFLLVFGFFGLMVAFGFFWFSLKNNNESYVINRKRKILTVIQKSFGGVSRTYYKIASYNSASVNQTTIGKTFDFGDVKLTNEKFKSSIKMYDVPKPFEIVEYIRHLMFSS